MVGSIFRGVWLPVIGALVFLAIGGNHEAIVDSLIPWPPFEPIWPEMTELERQVAHLEGLRERRDQVEPFEEMASFVSGSLTAVLSFFAVFRLTSNLKAKFGDKIKNGAATGAHNLGAVFAERSAEKQIGRYKTLLESGVITQTEFETKMAEIRSKLIGK